MVGALSGHKDRSKAFARYRTIAMKTLGYVNQFGRGIEMVKEELETNRNGLPEFKFDDITTFKVIVMNADLEAVKAIEDDAEKLQKGYRKDTDIINKITDNQYNTESVSINVGEKVTDRVTETIQKRYRKWCRKTQK